MSATLTDFVRLIVLILFLPVIIIFVGPLLVLAVVRGRQRMGPITLDSARYNFAGKAGMAMLGIAIWLLVWSGLAWLAIAATSPAPTLVQAPPVSPAVTTNPSVTAAPLAATNPLTTINPSTTVDPAATKPIVEPSFTLTPSPTVMQTANTSTPTPALSIPTATLGPIIPVATTASTPTPTPLFTGTAEAATALPTLSSAESTPAAPITLSVSRRQAALAAIDQANVLLQNAITLANEENLENLSIVWQDRALVGMRIFAARLSERYTQPFNVQFEYIAPPAIIAQNSPDQVVIASREKWSYGWLSNVDQDVFEYTYTLDQENGVWFITKYSFRNLSLSTPTATLVAKPVTETPVSPQN